MSAFIGLFIVLRHNSVKKKIASHELRMQGRHNRSKEGGNSCDRWLRTVRTLGAEKGAR
jgi:hypothetical protein